MTIIIITIAAAVVLIVWACIRMAAENDPCRDCPHDTCHECEYWKEAVGDDNKTA